MCLTTNITTRTTTYCTVVLYCGRGRTGGKQRKNTHHAAMLSFHSRCYSSTSKVSVRTAYPTPTPATDLGRGYEHNAQAPIYQYHYFNTVVSIKESI